MPDTWFWARQRNIAGTGTSGRPALATFNNRLLAAWTGIAGDDGIYWATSDGRSWTAQSKIGGVGTSVGPGLAPFNNLLYAAWQGIPGDDAIYWSSFNGAAWAPQQNIGGVGTSLGPALGVVGGQLYAVWKGNPGDDGLYFSSFNGAEWAAQQKIGGVGSTAGPSLATLGPFIYALLPGIPGDDGLYWSTLFDNTTASIKLGFTMQAQTQTNWCWAAVSTSFSHFYNGASTWTQCGAANQQLGQTTCCTTPGSTACNQAGYLDKAMTTMGILDAFQGGTVPVTTLNGEVLRSLPVGIRIAWSGGGAHSIAVTGSVSTTGLVHVQDPIYGTSDIAYNTLATAYQGTGSWTHTYFSKP